MDAPLFGVVRVRGTWTTYTYIMGVYHNVSVWCLECVHPYPYMYIAHALTLSMLTPRAELCLQGGLDTSPIITAANGNALQK